ncbi:MAG: AAA family ATPase [Pseudomonadota bacterium]|nr:AAA family ATPase [Pseudomonadota bacterium]
MTETIRITAPRGPSGEKDPNDFDLSGNVGLLLGEIAKQIKDHERETSERFPFLYPHEMEADEEVEFAVDGWLEAGGIHLLYAKKDCLKSFLAVDWFLCIVSGKPWKGFAVQQGAGAYIAGEGNRGLRRRIKAWCIRNGATMTELTFVSSKWPMQVLDTADISQWAAHLKEAEKTLGEPIRFVVIDTLATNFGPGDENSPTDMARFLAHLKIFLQSEFPGCTVLVVHHQGKDGTRGARGGSAIEANADSVHALTRIAETDLQAVTLECKHIKDTERPPSMMLKGVAVELGTRDLHGFPLTSLVLEHRLDPAEQDILRLTKEGKSQRAIGEEVGKSHTIVRRVHHRLKAQKLL